MKEQVVQFGSKAGLIGVLTEPESLPPGQLPPAVLFMNAGLIHRVGPNRVYVKLARSLANQGFVALRFDLSGIGDSRARTDNLSIENRILADVTEAMDFLRQTRGIDRFLLMGHCAGAFISFGVASRDPRVAGVVMLNAEGGDTEWDSYDRKRKTSRYYENYYSRGVMTNPDKWKKLLTGRADYASIVRNVFKNILWNRVSTVLFKLQNRLTGARRTTTRPEIATLGAGLRTLAQRGTPTLIVYSQGSTGLERARLLIGGDLRELSASGKVKLEILPQADHTFTLLAAQTNLVQLVSGWCAQFLPEQVSAR